jgi:hypothetical protein
MITITKLDVNTHGYAFTVFAWPFIWNVANWVVRRCGLAPDRDEVKTPVRSPD